MTFASLSHRTYSWGILRTSAIRHDATLIIHPEDAENIAAIDQGGDTSFTDEQGTRWIVTREDIDGSDALVFYRAPAAGFGRMTVRFLRDEFQFAA